MAANEERSSQDPDSRARRPALTAAPHWSRWLWLIAPAVAVAEIVAQAVVHARVPRVDDWRQAHRWIAQQRRPGELVASAPEWTSPLARRYFADLISLGDAARPDARRYPRAYVATAYGAEHPDFRGWREERSQSFGRLRVRVLANPQHRPLRYDFTEHLRPGEATVTRGGPEPLNCNFQQGLPVLGGGLGQGALGPPERFQCSSEGWNYVGVTVIEDMEHRGRRCLWSHPVQGVEMRTRFERVPLGRTIHGHHAIAYEAERGDDLGNVGAPVELRVLVDDQEVGTSIHRDGEGWKAFDFDTAAFADGAHSVTFVVRAEQAGNRHYCFEGVTF